MTATQLAQAYSEFRASIKMPPTRDKLLDDCLNLNRDEEPITHKNPAKSRSIPRHAQKNAVWPNYEEAMRHSVEAPASKGKQ